MSSTSANRVRIRLFGDWYTLYLYRVDLVTSLHNVFYYTVAYNECKECVYDAPVFSYDRGEETRHVIREIVNNIYKINCFAFKGQRSACKSQTHL